MAITRWLSKIDIIIFPLKWSYLVSGKIILLNRINVKSLLQTQADKPRLYSFPVGPTGNLSWK